MSDDIPINDITQWNEKPLKYLEFMKKLGEGLPKDPVTSSSAKIRSGYRELNLSVIQVYSLLNVALKLKPNGFYTMHLKGSPIDNLIWWDFLIESKIGFIHLWRTNSRFECHYEVSDKSFDIDSFFQSNIKKYKNEINEFIVRNLETHKLFINHFSSYRKSIDYLWDELKTTNVKEPISISFTTTEEEFKQWQNEINEFNKNLVKRHVLGKALILSSAFAAESLINNLLRSLMTPFMHERPKIIKAALKLSFADKLEHLDYHCPYVKKLDMNHDAVKNILKLMEIRNKYVHADESSHLNQIGEVHFDKDFPIFEVEHKSNIVTGMLKSFGEPSFLKIEAAYKAIGDFAKYIEENLEEGVRKNLWQLMKADPLGFNTKKNVYSAIFSENMASFNGIFSEK